jgi:hypothetical protein
MTEIRINRAPFLTLWATVVAERVGFDPDEALTLGKAVAGLTAQAKGRRLGIFEQRPAEELEKVRNLREGMDAKKVPFMGRLIPCVKTEDGIRTLVKAKPVDPASVQRYLAGRFADNLPLVRAKLATLAGTYEQNDLLVQAMNVYMRLRPNVPTGREGWGKQGLLDTDKIDRLIKDREADAAG